MSNTYVEFYYLIYMQGAYALYEHNLYVSGWQLSDCGFCQYNLMTNS